MPFALSRMVLYCAKMHSNITCFISAMSLIVSINVLTDSCTDSAISWAEWPKYLSQDSRTWQSTYHFSYLSTRQSWQGVSILDRPTFQVCTQNHNWDWTSHKVHGQRLILVCWSTRDTGKISSRGRKFCAHKKIVDLFYLDKSVVAPGQSPFVISLWQVLSQSAGRILPKPWAVMLTPGSTSS